MPLINHSEPEKIFHGTTTRIRVPTVSTKKKSQDTLKNFSVNPFPPSSAPKESRYIAGTALPNSTIRNSLLQLESTINTTLKDEKNKKIKADKSKGLYSTDESSSSTLESNLESVLNKSNSKILELRAGYQKILSSSQNLKHDVAAFEPRRPTMEAIREAIEKTKQLEINRHKKVGTADDTQNFFKADASTSTDSQKGKKKKTLKKCKITYSSTTSSLQSSTTKNVLKKNKKVNDGNKKGKSSGKKKP